MARSQKQTTGLKFECTQCGKCCTQRGTYAHVYVEEEEVRALAAVVGLSTRTFRRRHTYVDELGWTQLRFDGELCPFLEPTTNRCTVYAARPLQCRTFPFWGELIDHNGWTAEARSLCEGVGHGPVQRAGDVETSIRQMKEAG